jgi:glycosyltransferase involved in cell wall biosynthesis
MADGNPSGPLCVAMVVRRFHARNLGGAERQLQSVAPLLIDRGIRPVIITRSAPGNRTSPSGGDLELVRIPVPNQRWLDTPVFVRGARRALGRVRPAVVHAFNTFSQTSVAVAHKRATGTPFAVKPLRSGDEGDLQRLARKPFGRRRLGALVEHADGFMVISSEVDDELAALGVDPARRHRIPNGVDLERFSPADPAQRSEARAALGLDLPPDAPVVLAVGRLSPEKRMRELSLLWPQVRARHPDATLVIVGKVTGPVDDELVRVASTPGVVHFEARADIEVAYRAADVYASASAAEGLSNALLEAMASGLACVVTEVGGVADVVDAGVSGESVAPDALDRLVAVLGDVVGDRNRRVALGAGARAVMEQRYGLDVVADSLAALYESLAGSRRS